MSELDHFVGTRPVSEAHAFDVATLAAYLDAHHLRHWAEGGETSLRNAVLVCRLCRYRHKRHYADIRIMPTRVTRPRCAEQFGGTRSA